MGIKLPLGVESFAELRDNNFYYVDKTEFIKELIETEFKVNLITRPRRFGKTLTMSMLEDFFDITRNSVGHFKGLKILEDTALCGEWMNRWPVIFLSLKGVEGVTFQDAYGRLEVLIADLSKKYGFLGDSIKVNPADKKIFLELMYQEANKQNLSNSFLLLTRMMSAHFGRQCILLIDEYDVPLAKANDCGFYGEMLDTIRILLRNALKTNEFLKFAVITGCLKISKESIFTGLNNVVANTITTERFDEHIGFTEADVQALLADSGFSGHGEEIRIWYDGYRFGAADVYCPWDVLNHVADLQENPSAPPANHWAATSHNDIIYKLFENKEFDVNAKFETLMGGGCIREAITEDLTNDSLEASEENLWSLLFMTGYLTQAKEASSEAAPLKFCDAEQNGNVEEGYSAEEGCSAEKGGIAEDSSARGYRAKGREVLLRIPNEEVKYIFKKAVIDWFKRDVQTLDRTVLFKALWEADTQAAGREISDLLFNAISYHDYQESYYHAFVAGLFAGAGYIVESNYEYGTSRPDVVIKEKRKRRAILMEVKHAKGGETLEDACDKAVWQIQEKRYAQALEGYRTVICYGIAFKGKDCMVRRNAI